MKKLLGISALTLLLTACSQSSDKTQPPSQQPLTPEQVQQELHKALQECYAAVGDKDLVKFDACMDQKGFEKIQKDKPAQQTPAKKTK